MLRGGDLYCRLRCGQRGFTCARHITLDWFGLDLTVNDRDCPREFTVIGLQQNVSIPSKNTYSVKSKSSLPLKLFFNIFCQANSISMKCCQYINCQFVSTFHSPHTFTNFGQFTIIFNKIALIFRSNHRF